MEWIKIAQRRIKITDLIGYEPYDHFVDLKSITTPNATNYTLYQVNFSYHNYQGSIYTDSESFDNVNDRNNRLKELDEIFLNK